MAQVGPKLSVRGRAGEGRPESGVKAAARELGIERHEAQRAIKIAALAPEAKAEAVVLRLDNNQTALLRAEKASPDKEQQIRALREAAARRASRITGDEATASEKRIEAAFGAVKLRGWAASRRAKDGPISHPARVPSKKAPGGASVGIARPRPANTPSLPWGGESAQGLALLISTTFRAR